MVDRNERDRWVQILQTMLLQKSNTDARARAAGWYVESKDRTLSAVVEDLTESLVTCLPTSPRGDPDREAMETHQHSIRRAIALLQSEYEYPQESWLAQWWFPSTLLAAIGAFVATGYVESVLLERVACVLLGGVFGMLWIGSALLHSRCFWHIVQVRILRRDLTAASITADAAGYVPFLSAADARRIMGHDGRV